MQLLQATVKRFSLRRQRALSLPTDLILLTPLRSSELAQCGCSVPALREEFRGGEEGQDINRVVEAEVRRGTELERECREYIEIEHLIAIFWLSTLRSLFPSPNSNAISPPDSDSPKLLFTSNLHADWLGQGGERAEEALEAPR